MMYTMWMSCDHITCNHLWKPHFNMFLLYIPSSYRIRLAPINVCLSAKTMFYEHFSTFKLLGDIFRELHNSLFIPGWKFVSNFWMWNYYSTYTWLNVSKQSNLIHFLSLQSYQSPLRFIVSDYNRIRRVTHRDADTQHHRVVICHRIFHAGSPFHCLNAPYA